MQHYNAVSRQPPEWCTAAAQDFISEMSTMLYNSTLEQLFEYIYIQEEYSSALIY